MLFFFHTHSTALRAVLILFFSIFYIGQLVECHKPPKSYCTPNAGLIAYVTGQPKGFSLCSSLKKTPKVVTVTATGPGASGTGTFGTGAGTGAMEEVIPMVTLTVPGIPVTVTATATQLTAKISNYTNTLYTTGYSNFTSSITGISNTTLTATLQTTILTFITKTVTNKVTITANTTRTLPINSNFNPEERTTPTITVFDPTRFPLSPRDLDSGLLRKRQNNALPSWATSIAFTSLTSACDCIVGLPTSTKTSVIFLNTGNPIGPVGPTGVPGNGTGNGTTATVTGPAPTITITTTLLNSTTTKAHLNQTFTVSQNETILTTKLANNTVYTTIPITFTSTQTITEGANATATAYPDCLGPAYSENEGYVGTGNIVKVFPVTGNGTVKCCNACQETPDCVANYMDGLQCELLINDKQVDGDEVTETCPLGIESFPFVGEGKLYPGPCGF